jgi:osmotically-inducible protein OsmY
MRAVAALAALLAMAALSACDRNDSQTAGQRMDNATARTEQKAQEAKEDAKDAAGKVAQATEKAGNEVSNKVKDAAITTAVNAKIAQDKKLSVLRINVDTVDGKVLLKGSAPDAGSAERAQQLAASVEGVVSVDNQLVVGGKG